MELKDEIFDLRNQGLTYDEISDRLNCAKGTISYHLNEGTREYYRERRRSNRKKQVVDLKQKYGGKCKCCGYNDSLEPLQFHHLDPSEKDGDISRLFTTKGKAAAFAEAAKCLLVCCRCHVEIHSGYRDINYLVNS